MKYFFVRAILISSITLCAVFLSDLCTPHAHASDYRIEDVAWFSPGALSVCKRNEVQTTSALLSKLRTNTQRSTFAKASGEKIRDVERWTRHLEFLQLDGVGPKVAELLVSLQIGGVSELAKHDASLLLKEIENAQHSKMYLRKMPSEFIVQGWIDSAKIARIVAEF